MNKILKIVIVVSVSLFLGVVLAINIDPQGGWHMVFWIYIAYAGSIGATFAGFFGGFLATLVICSKAEEKNKNVIFIKVFCENFIMYFLLFAIIVMIIGLSASIYYSLR